jgi:hypothetical protein
MRLGVVLINAQGDDGKGGVSNIAKNQKAIIRSS